MKKFICALSLLTVFCAPLFAQQAGITSPSITDTVFSAKYSGDVTENGDYLFDGWANPGNIGIKLYINGSRTNLNCNNCGTWSITKDFDAGVNHVYIESRKDFDVWVRSDDRDIIFVKRIMPGDVRNTDGDYDDKNKIEWPYYNWNQTGNSITKIPYFKVWRNTIDNTNGGTWKSISNWQTSKTLDDTDVEPGTYYYYFIEVSPYNNGTYNSNYSDSKRIYAKATLSLSPSNEQIIDPSGEIKTIDVVANTDFIVTDSPNWVSVEQLSNQIKITVGENNTGSLRSGQVTLSAGTDAPTTRKITISQESIPLIINGDFTITPDSICVGQTINFTSSYDNNEETPTSFHWSFGNGDTAITEHANYVFQTIGEYTVRLILSNDQVADTVSKSIVINALPQVDLGEYRGVCEGEIVMLDAGTDGEYYYWNTDEQTQTIIVDSSGNYAVEVISPFGCVANDSIAVSVFINPIINLGNDTTICDSGQVVLDAGLDYKSYLWSTGDTTQTTVADETNTYTVQVTDDNDCMASDEVVVTVEICTSVRKLDSKQDVFIYPNPVNNLLTITINETTKGNITLRSMDGKIVLQETFNGAQKTFDVSQLTSGVYIIELVSNSGERIIEKIVKE